MSSTEVMPRHALGWPPGSVRALLALMVVLLVCALMLLPSKPDSPLPIPAYLLYLLFLVLGHYFAARGSTRGQHDPWHRQPLHLPRGLIRLLIVAALTATVIYKYTTNPTIFEAQLEESVRSLRDTPLLPVIILASFFVGVLLRMVIGHFPPFWYQDLEAWVSLIAVLLMGVATLIQLVIDPSLKEPLRLPEWEAVLSGVVAFYFGERS